MTKNYGGHLNSLEKTKSGKIRMRYLNLTKKQNALVNKMIWKQQMESFQEALGITLVASGERVSKN